MPRKKHTPAANELLLALGLVVRRIRSAAPQAAQELSWTQLAVMARLSAEGPATTADLARALGVKPQSMGATVAALADLALVQRRPHPTDGRQVHIALTAKGASVRQDARTAKRTWLAAAIAKLDDAEQQSLPALTALLKRLGES